MIWQIYLKRPTSVVNYSCRTTHSHGLVLPNHAFSHQAKLHPGVSMIPYGQSTLLKGKSELLGQISQPLLSYVQSLLLSPQDALCFIQYNI